MAGVRAGLGVLVASVMLAPATAWACEEHDPDERERVAGRSGDTVSIDIPNTLEGAEWAIRVEDGDELAEGRDETPQEGTEAEFEVPDLGVDEERVDIVVSVTHDADGADWSYEVELDYRGRQAPEAPKEAEPEPTPRPKPDERPPPPPPAPERSSDAQASPAPASSAPPPPPPPAPAGPAELTAPAPSPAPSPVSVAPGGKTPSPVGDVLDAITAAGTAIPAGTVAAAATRDGAQQRSRRRSRRRSARPEPQALPAPARPRRHEPATDGGGFRLPDVDLPGLGSGLAWSLIGGGGLAFALAGLGVAGLGRHRRRRLSSPV